MWDNLLGHQLAESLMPGDVHADIQLSCVSAESLCNGCARVHRGHRLACWLACLRQSCQFCDMVTCSIGCSTNCFQIVCGLLPACPFCKHNVHQWLGGPVNAPCMTLEGWTLHVPTPCCLGAAHCCTACAPRPSFIVRHPRWRQHASLPAAAGAHCRLRHDQAAAAGNSSHHSDSRCCSRALAAPVAAGGRRLRVQSAAAAPPRAASHRWRRRQRRPQGPER